MKVIFEIFNGINEIRENCDFDTEANFIYYNIGFKKGKIMVHEMSVYYSDGDEWGCIDSDVDAECIQTIDGQTLSDYCNAVVDYIKHAPELRLRFGDKIYNLIEFENVGDD